MKRDTKPSCFLCGDHRVFGARCLNCGFNQSDYWIVEDALKIEKLTPQCPYITQVANWQRCTREVIIAGSSINSMSGYRCAGCRQYVHRETLLLNNMDKIKEQVSKRMAHQNAYFNLCSFFPIQEVTP